MYIIVSFSIHSEELRHEDITAKTNIQPDAFHHKGDIKKSRTKPIVMKLGMWGIDSKLDRQTTDFDTQISGLLDVLDPHAEYFAELSRTASVRFFCTVADLPHGGEIQPNGLLLMPGAGIRLEATTLTRMGSIGAELDVSFM